MERGGIYAVANLRGGGEYGEEWHQAGSRLHKQNVFDDFIAAAEWLIASGYTSAERLAIAGRQQRRPAGRRASIDPAPGPVRRGARRRSGCMDMLRFHTFTIGWGWVGDYGSPDDPEEFKACTPTRRYHNLKPGTDYPATLITTADHDDRVVPAHSFKFAAALQARAGRGRSGADPDRDPGRARQRQADLQDDRRGRRRAELPAEVARAERVAGRGDLLPRVRRRADGGNRPVAGGAEQGRGRGGPGAVDPDHRPWEVTSSLGERGFISGSGRENQ